jgi:hypothetical protein
MCQTNPGPCKCSARKPVTPHGEYWEIERPAKAKEDLNKPYGQRSVDYPYGNWSRPKEPHATPPVSDEQRTIERLKHETAWLKKRVDAERANNINFLDEVYRLEQRLSEVRDESDMRRRLLIAQNVGLVLLIIAGVIVATVGR